MKYKVYSPEVPEYVWYFETKEKALKHKKSFEISTIHKYVVEAI